MKFFWDFFRLINLVLAFLFFPVQLILFVPLALLYSLGVKIHRSIYQMNILAPFQTPFFTCSIGNLTAGGTGKTPFLHWLIDYLKKRKKRKDIWVIGHGYGGKSTKVACVNMKLKGATDKLCARHGDESTWLALQHPDIPVYTGPSKTQVAKALTYFISQQFQQANSRRKEPCILLDDGFQHWGLHRSFDVVLLDATQDFFDYLPLPLGKARERWSALRRADLIVITKANFVAKAEVQAILKKVPKYIPCVTMAYDIKSFLNLSSGERINKTQLREKLFCAVSAIGNPESFSQILREGAEIDLLQHFALKDHSPRIEKKLNQVLDVLNTLNQDNKTEKIHGVIITEKDAVKIWHRRKDFPKVWVAEMQVLPYDKFKELPSIYEVLQSIF